MPTCEPDELWACYNLGALDAFQGMPARVDEEHELPGWPRDARLAYLRGYNAD